MRLWAAPQADNSVILNAAPQSIESDPEYNYPVIPSYRHLAKLPYETLTRLPDFTRLRVNYPMFISTCSSKIRLFNREFLAGIHSFPVLFEFIEFTFRFFNKCLSHAFIYAAAIGYIWLCSLKEVYKSYTSFGVFSLGKLSL